MPFVLSMYMALLLSVGWTIEVLKSALSVPITENVRDDVDDKNVCRLILLLVVTFAADSGGVVLFLMSLILWSSIYLSFINGRVLVGKSDDISLCIG